jgi:hypothetical protein
MADELERRGNGPGHGGPARGYSWKPFEKGEPGPALRHGCRSVLTLAPRAGEIAERLHEMVPWASPSDAATIDLLATSLAQVERAALLLSIAQRAELEDVKAGRPTAVEGRDDLKRLSSDARDWASTAARLCDQLALSPGSRARLGVDIARGTSIVMEMQERAREADEA